jgi:putative transcriptional regulator
MLAMIKHHPSATVLRAHALGELSDGYALAVATHLSLCPQCRTAYEFCEVNTFEQQVDPSSPNSEESLDGNLDAMLQSILNEQITPELRDRRSKERFSLLEINGEWFEVPWPLQRLAGQVQRWRKEGGRKVWVASMPLENDAHRAGFLYLDKNSQMPLHARRGHELMMILAGSLHDEGGSYGAGDFIMQTPEDRSTPPKTNSQESCLCLTVLSEPLRLSKGLEKTLNPFSNFLY